jgi:hypothetical protein
LIYFQSLEAFYSLLEEAENKARGESGSDNRRRGRDRDDRGGRHSNFKRPSRYSDSDGEKDSREDRHSGSSSRHHHNRDRDRDRERSWRKDRDKSPFSRSGRDKSPSWRKKNPEKVDRKRTDDRDREDHTKRSQPILKEKVDSPEISNSDEEMDTDVPETKPAVLTDKEMNELNAKLFKAELLGDVVR